MQAFFYKNFKFFFECAILFLSIHYKEVFMNVEERFLRYAACWTASEEHEEESAPIPSTKCQFDLGQMLEKELSALGLEKVVLTDHCYVYGLLPATPGYEEKPAVGFIAHMDTSPDYSGKDVKPQIIPSYDGGNILLKGSGESIRVSDFPHLKDLTGRTLITADGTTLLGADDKAGIAEILTAVEELMASGQPHGDIWIGFTPDEEVGRGAELFDLDYFKADFAYTLDGSYEGEVAFENFNAASARFSIRGKGVHPGEAKDVMVNAVLIACEIQSMLPADEIPARTEGREGFYHLMDLKGDVTSAFSSYIVRDHDKGRFEARKARLREIESQLNQTYGDGTVTLTLTDSYFNMKEIIDAHPDVVELARRAITAAGLTPVSFPVRGGTDGATLTFRGLPCPNLGTGGHAFHGPFEHVSVEGMETAVRIIKNIITFVAE